MPIVLAAAAVTLFASLACAQLIQKWKTPAGMLYFGDRPPAGSTLVGTTQSLGTTGGGDVKPARKKRVRRAAASRERDRHGRLRRSSAARMHFLRSHGLTRTPRGCQVDHVVPLAKGGADSPANMQLLCGASLREKESNELR